MSSFRASRRDFFEKSGGSAKDVVSSVAAGILVAAQRRASVRLSQVGFFEKRGGSAKDVVSTVAAGIFRGGSAKGATAQEKKLASGISEKKCGKTKKKDCST